MDGSEPPVVSTPVHVTEALVNGEADDQLDMNSAESSSGDTEDDVVQTIETVEDSIFDTASVGTDPHSTLF